MKIGILSMQKILNYGSFLQAFSLKMQFEQRGHEVFFIDIKPGRKIVNLPPNKINLLSKFDKYVFKRIENYILSKKMKRIHIDDYTKYLEINKKLSEGEKYDLVVIGSDEVFNATQPSSWGFTTQLFGYVENAKKVVTYAASCGQTTYESIEKYGITQDIAKSMKNFSSISVRDFNTYDFVKKLTGKEPYIHVDPVFLSDYDMYIPAIKTKKPYILIYAYPNRISDEKDIAAIKKFANKQNLQILCIGMQQRWCSNNKPATAFELLGYFKNADYVITDTFHGTVFSIKYNKKFGVLIRESNRNKLSGLLNQFGLMDRCINDAEDIGSVMTSPINYKTVNLCVEQEKEKAYRYLNDISQLE